MNDEGECITGEREPRESSRDRERIFYANKVFRCKSFQFLQKIAFPHPNTLKNESQYTSKSGLSFCH